MCVAATGCCDATVARDQRDEDPQHAERHEARGDRPERQALREPVKPTGVRPVLTGTPLGGGYRQLGQAQELARRPDDEQPAARDRRELEHGPGIDDEQGAHGEESRRAQRPASLGRRPVRDPAPPAPHRLVELDRADQRRSGGGEDRAGEAQQQQHGAQVAQDGVPQPERRREILRIADLAHDLAAHDT